MPGATPTTRTLGASDCQHGVGRLQRRLGQGVGQEIRVEIIKLLVQQVHNNGQAAFRRGVVQGACQLDRRRHIGVHMRVQPGVAEIQVAVVIEQGSVVHHAVDPLQRFDRRRQQAAHGLLIGQVAPQGDGAPAQGGNSLRHFARFVVRVAVVDGDVPAGARQAQRDFAAQAAAGAGYQGHARLFGRRS